MDNIDDLKSALPFIAKKLNSKFPYAYVWCMQKHGMNISITLKSDNIENSPVVKGTVISIFNGVEVIEYSIDSLKIEDIEKLAEEIISKEEVYPFEGEYCKDKELIAKDYITEESIKLSSIEKGQKFANGKAKLDYAKTLKLDNCDYYYAESDEYYLFVDPYKVLYQKNPKVAEYLDLYKSNTEGLKKLSVIETGRGGYEIASINESKINKYYEDLLLICNAEKLTPGEYVITGSHELAGLLAHEAFGHGVEMDMMYKGRAKSVDYFGKKVANVIVNISDDPTIKGNYGTYFFDDEGAVPQKTNIIKNGIFNMGLNDRYSSFKMNVGLTGNGRRQDFKHKAYSRMSSTFFEEGKSTEKEIIESIEYGIYLDHFTLGMEDPKNWGIQITFLLGKEIKNGKFTGKTFSPIGITGNVIDILNNITMVGNKVSFEGGVCGKGHKEWVTNCTGGPMLKTKATLV